MLLNASANFFELIVLNRNNRAKKLFNVRWLPFCCTMGWKKCWLGDGNAFGWVRMA